MKFRHAAAVLMFALLAAQASAQTPGAPQPGAPQPGAPQPGAPPEQVPAASADVAYSASGLYNLANSYARAGNSGLAVLNYERAALLAPRDADIQANLRYLQTSLNLPIEARSRLENIAHLASPAAVAAIGVIGLMIAGASLLMTKLIPQRRAAWIGGLVIGLAAIGFTGCNAVFWGRKINEAVVIAATTPVRATPVPMSDPLQQLSEAETVAVTEGHEDFVLVRTASGRSGWVARADLANVVPKRPVR